MTHVEICCQICGVSFNIGRYPTKDEATAAIPDTQWLRNTQALRAQARGTCGEGCYLAKVIEMPSDSDIRQVVVESMEPVSKVKSRRYTSDEQHISGPACFKPGGYSGHSITPEEIRGSCTFQCFVPKPRRRRLLMRPINTKESVPDPDFYLSGISDIMPSQGYVYSTWPLGRELPGLLYARNWFSNSEDAEKAAMPCHPTCLEVFRRVSAYYRADIDDQSLMDWYRFEAKDEKHYHEFPRHPSVRKAQRYWQNGRDQLWLHLPGSEFLAANPCFVPALPPIIASATVNYDVLYKHSNISPVDPSKNQGSDSLSRLPIEIRLHLASLLNASDFANLRLVSRTFHNLPQSFYRSFIHRELPWLWETWSDSPYSIYAGFESWELRLRDTNWENRKAKLERDIRSLQDAIISGVDSEQNLRKIKTLRDCIAKEEAEYKKSREPIPPQRLPCGPDEVDWFGLYCTLSHNFDNLKGLRNRKRIWKDCDEIVRQIKKYRAEGLIKPAVSN
ncbi:unnamed protein product [Clonostachys rosea f. rosea IK726]|uniref:Uncharacterized protein n=1 Tax=Clonostachys rosea f. rosea IK726 TaxID=1349383 RepID=A0ACA9U574_BIOOC|nr:unnamed protein product [Clonostachys rosea f. rosea IK726]